MSFKNRLRSSVFLAGLYRRYRDFISGPGWGAFHHDPIYKRLMLDLVEAFPFTSFVETGTYRGYSSELIASNKPKLPVFTSEVYEPNYHLARSALRKYGNVTAELCSSDKWIQQALATHRFSDFPLFFLDAHWQTYWPLRAELKHLSDARMRAVIVIDDFEVPGQSQFGFDIDGGGTLTEGLKCNLEYIAPSLGNENTYRVVFPKYTYTDSFGQAEGGMLRGHVVLFQNAVAEYEQFLTRPLAASHYFGFSMQHS